MARHPHIRELIKDAQRILGVETDGLPGPNTEQALTELMTNQHRPVVKPATLLTLLYEHMRQADKPQIWVDHKIAHAVRARPDEKPEQKLIDYLDKPKTKERILPSKKPLMPPQDAPWLDWVLGHLGEKEDESEDNNPFIVRLWEIIGITWTHTNDIDSDVPWCAALVGAALAHTGYQHTGSGLARSYLSYGIPLSEFRRGCIMIWPRGSNPRAGHVDLGIKLDDGIVETVGGNVKNQIALGKRAIKKVIGMRWPILEVTA